MQKKEPEVIQGKGYLVEISRTSRTKTASLKVEDGVVMVVVPKKLDIAKIEKLVADKHVWIMSKIALHSAATPASNKQYVSDEAFPYLGRNYRLKVLKGELEPTKLINGRMTISIPDITRQHHYIRRLLVHWYKRNAFKKDNGKGTAL